MSTATCDTSAIDPAADYSAALLREPDSAYHARKGEYLTSHLLTDFRRCPFLFRQKQLGVIPDEDRPAYVVGRALHTLVLEGEQRFEDTYAVGGPINEKTGLPFGPNTKAFAEWADQHGKSVLTEAQHGLVRSMAASVRRHEFAQSLLADGVAEGVVRAEYCGVRCQSRLDWLDPHQGIVDLKTCDDLTWFEADARRFGYGNQVAFYRAVLARVIGVPMPAHFIAVEKKEPYRCGVWKVTENTLGAAQRENEAAIERLKRCRDSNEWPTGYEDCRFFDYV